MKPFLFILRGAPASGKSTIAKRLRNFENRIAWLKVDNFKDFFADDASKALDFVHGSAISTLDYLLDNGFSVVMDGVFQSTGFIDKSLKVARSKNIPAHVFELICSVETLIQRDKNREGVKEGCRKPLEEGVLKKLHKIVTDNPYPGAIRLNADENSIDECLEVIKKNN